MRRALALTHLEDTDHRPQVNDRLILRGTVDSDTDEHHRVPMLVIDGREISWDELGRWGRVGWCSARQRQATVTGDRLPDHVGAQR